MKKILIVIVLLFTILSINISASDIPSEEIGNSEIVALGQDKPEEKESTIAIIFATLIILMIVGLASTFISKFALSIRDKDDNKIN